MIALSQVLEVIGSIPIPPPLFLLNKKKKSFNKNCSSAYLEVIPEICDVRLCDLKKSWLSKKNFFCIAGISSV